MRKHFWMLLLAGTAAFSEGKEVALFGQKKESPKCTPAFTSTQPTPKSKTYYCWPSDNQWASYNTWVNFLYWQAVEENLEPAAVKINPLFTGFAGVDAGYVVNMAFDFKPAFQLGFGVNFDYGELDLRGEYTRFCSRESLAQSANSYYPMQLDPATLISFINGISNAAGLIGGATPYSYAEVWKLQMNLGDLDVGSWWIRGKILEVHPFAGLRTAFINQQLQVGYTAHLVNGGDLVGTAGATVNTDSWALGPRGGIATNWKLGKGFKFYWNGAGDLLYTIYTWHGRAFASVPDAGMTDVGPVNLKSNVTEGGIASLRTHLDIDLGFRWGICLNDDKSRFELSAGYGFQVFFDQNMFRHFTTDIEEIGVVGFSETSEVIGLVSTPLSTSPNGNLYIQGLKVSAEYAF